ncbi:MAG: dihydroorotase [Gudongella sp.]|nr:dihydroorotase [Gudongella sp.]
MELLVKGARIIDEGMDFVGDLYIKDGKIYEFGENLSYKCKYIDGTGLVLMPAFIDLHAHFRDPGYTHKEDLKTGSLAALKGGYTFVNLMGNTKPISSNMDVVKYVLDKASNLDLIDVHQCVSITENFDGKRLDHLDKLDSRVKIISDDGKGINSNITMYNAMLKAKEKGLTILTHAEDEDLTPIDYRISENIVTIRDIYLASVTDCMLHLTHVSTKEAIDAIRIAKQKGYKNLTCDVTPHHIALYDNDYRVNPPIRQENDVKSIIEGIVDGTIDTIATDHAPHTKEDKENGSPGLSGLETAFSVCYTSLVREGHIDLKRLSSLFSGESARIMGINKGKIKVGYDADLVLLNIDKKSVVDSSKFLSKGKNTPFDGMEFFGEVQMTIKAGKIRYVNRD